MLTTLPAGRSPAPGVIPVPDVVTDDTVGAGGASLRSVLDRKTNGDAGVLAELTVLLAAVGSASA